jgi:hypothetical protein
MGHVSHNFTAHNFGGPGPAADPREALIGRIIHAECP